MICGMLMTMTNLIKAEYNRTQDKELYEKYDLSDEEVAFIESMVRPEVGV